jgi:hypothetical protein
VIGVIASPAMRALLLLAVASAACQKTPAPAITSAWKDDFERAELGADYATAKADSYRVSGGQLNAQGAVNHPLWLRRKLPASAVIELDVKSNSASGDIKVEAWGDGVSHAKDRGQYTSTGYVFVMGGWSNSKSILAKGNEHGQELSQRTTPKVEPGKVYHWKIVRNGGQIDWFVDDMQTPFLSLTDPAPLTGDGHAYFGFNDWESDLWFDNLTITPL